MSMGDRPAMAHKIKPHIRADVPGARDAVCEICGEETTCDFKVNPHIERHHSEHANPPLWICRGCWLRLDAVPP